MTKKIKDIKADMKRLHTLFQAICKVFPSEGNTIIGVMLHNLYHDSSHCANYVGDEAEWKEMNDIKDAIEAFKTYNSYHTINFLVEEIEMSFFAHSQLELEELYVSGTHDPENDD